jgi:predicted esterase
MRNRALAFAAATILATVQLACSGEAARTAGDGTGAASPESSATPSQDLASASASANAGAGTVADFARTGAATTIGASNTDIPVDQGAGSGGASGGGSVDPNAGAGPKPTASCTVSKDADGFFTRSSSKSSYVAYVPASYDGSKPVRLIVGLHGCGDSAYNFATWGVNPYDTRATQQHIGISIGGQDGNCWNLGVDDDKVLAAVDDISKCFWVHQKKVAIAGFSSGGQLAYRVGLKQASRFAAILIEDSGLYAADNNPDALLANASWKVHVAHRTHTSDPVFPLAKVKADWVKTTAAGFPLLASETPGGHDGVSQDWANWLIPQSAAWTAP